MSVRSLVSLAMRSSAAVLLMLGLDATFGLRVSPLLRSRFACSSVSMCAAPDGQSGPARKVRVIAHNTELLSASTATVEKKQKTGIDSVSIGGLTINFSHDMTQTFKWGGLILGLVLMKIIRKGKYAWTEEPNLKYIASTAAEEAELHEFQCEECAPAASMLRLDMAVPTQHCAFWTCSQAASRFSRRADARASSFRTTTSANNATLRRR